MGRGPGGTAHIYISMVFFVCMAFQWTVRTLTSNLIFQLMATQSIHQRLWTTQSDHQKHWKHYRSARNTRKHINWVHRVCKRLEVCRRYILYIYISMIYQNINRKRLVCFLNRTSPMDTTSANYHSIGESHNKKPVGALTLSVLTVQMCLSFVCLYGVYGAWI